MKKWERELFEAHSAYALEMAAWYGRSMQYHDRAEVSNVALLALFLSIKRYDRKRKVKLITYATPKIRGALLDWMRTMNTVKRRQKGSATSLDDKWAKTQRTDRHRATVVSDIESLVKKMPTRRMREIAGRRIGEGATFKRLSEDMGISIGRVHQIWENAQEYLQQQIKVMG